MANPKSTALRAVIHAVIEEVRHTAPPVTTFCYLLSGDGSESVEVKFWTYRKDAFTAVIPVPKGTSKRGIKSLLLKHFEALLVKKNRERVPRSVGHTPKGGFHMVGNRNRPAYPAPRFNPRANLGGETGTPNDDSSPQTAQAPGHGAQSS